MSPVVQPCAPFQQIGTPFDYVQSMQLKYYLRYACMLSAS